MRINSPVLLVLTLGIGLAGLLLPLVNYAPNRLISGQGIGLATLIWGGWIGLAIPLAAWLALSLIPLRRAGLVVTLLLAELLFFALAWLAGITASDLAAQGGALVRTSFGSGYYSIAALCLLMAADAIGRLTRRPLLRVLLNLQIWLPLVWLLMSGRLDQLSLLKEYANRSDVFQQAFSGHLILLFGTLVPATLIGIPLGLFCHHSARWRPLIFSVLNVIQTVPAIALFGLLIAPLSGLATSLPWLRHWGISGIGLAPALIALVLYALLPLVRSVTAALEYVPASVIESARGMGMTGSQIFRRVQIPLGLPVILSGLRVIAVQTVGMGMIAALIGAGGFGSLMFQGLLSSALELVLLGVVPAIGLAVLVDTLFKLLISFMETKRP
ncbi:ABC transporter permease [Biostraticola tofi]|uniref:Osmoprotectant transport system permease protein n=1 Tax=Biostraticola tofi TaxID=466109 RepID=A0A4R3Z2M6_9GAMM|nr:ABC transporter permease [Biostraticola tofi]TCV98073.1 osmoprotectant transport system permease protein [Biostraticola tofi]